MDECWFKRVKMSHSLCNLRREAHARDPRERDLPCLGGKRLAEHAAEGSVGHQLRDEKRPSVRRHSGTVERKPEAPNDVQEKQ